MTRRKDSRLHAKTRDIYEAQHKRIAGDRDAFDRMMSLYTAKGLGLAAKWFQGKHALDAGCGNNGGMIVNLAEMGCRRVDACDIGTDWIPLLQKHLKTLKVPKGVIHLREGNVLDLPYEDATFDFVSINGVLLHLDTMDEIERGFAEGARVCKPGGYYFTAFGPCGGLMQGKVMPAVRQHYREDAGFKRFIDTISPDMIHGLIDKVAADSKKHGGPKIEAAFLKTLFGEDFCVFLQNFVQAPRWWSNECTPEYVEALYARHGFTEVRRLSDFVKRKDIRKYFAPLHYDRDHPVSQALYGRGYVKYVAKKA